MNIHEPEHVANLAIFAFVKGNAVLVGSYGVDMAGGVLQPLVGDARLKVTNLVGCEATRCPYAVNLARARRRV